MMMTSPMSSLTRVLTAINHKEPDRVPFFLLLTMHGAKELGMSIKEYFSRGENVAKGQLKLREKYQHDCLYNFFYAPLEVEAWGGEVIYSENGPPNSGKPFISEASDINKLTIPDINTTPCLQKVISSTQLLKDKVGDEAPIIGVVMSPFSLPVMQMGFGKYIELIYEQPDLFERLMAVNEQFCVSWANAQLDAGATAICYFDPVSSNTIIPKELYLETGFKIAKRTIARINGPTATHLASGRCLPIVEYIAQTGTALVGVSKEEDLTHLKDITAGKLALIGNLNGIEMRRWTPQDAEREVKSIISQAGKGGGLIISDHHGEIPWQVSDETLDAISHAVRKWGRYPIAV